MQWQKESRRIYFYIAEVQPIFHRNKGIAAGHIKKREKAAFWHYL